MQFYILNIRVLGSKYWEKGSVRPFVEATFYVTYFRTWNGERFFGRLNPWVNAVTNRYHSQVLKRPIQCFGTVMLNMLVLKTLLGRSSIVLFIKISDFTPLAPITTNTTLFVFDLG